MAQEKPDLNRRDFIKTSVAAAGAATLGASDYIKGLEEPFKYDDSPQYIEKPLRPRMRALFPDRVPS
jgi:hypothetical protein